MNKLFTKVGTTMVGIAMAVGVGVAVGRDGVKEVKAADVTISKTMTQIATANEWETSSNGSEVCYTSFNLDSNIQISTTGTANCGSYWGEDWRLYQNKSGNLIITALNGATLIDTTITYKVKNNGQLIDGSTAVASGTKVSLSGTTKTFTVGASSGSTGQVKVTQISVKYDDGQGAGTTYTVSFAAGEGSGTMDSVTDASATYTLPSTSTFTAPTNKILKGWRIGEDDYKLGELVSLTDNVTATALWIKDASDSSRPYTVAEAREAIDFNVGLTGVYAVGIVSEIVTVYSTEHLNVSINISANGLDTGDQLQGYRSTGSSASTVAVGDYVVLHGTLKKHYSTYEFDAGNVIESCKTSAEQIAEFSTNFLSAMRDNGVCGSTAARQEENNKVAVAAIWTTWKNNFAALSSQARALFVEKEVDETDVTDAVKLYKHCMARYGVGENPLAAWDEAPEIGGAVVTPLGNTVNNNGITVIVIIAAVITTLTVGGIFLFKKKEEK